MCSAVPKVFWSQGPLEGGSLLLAGSLLDVLLSLFRLVAVFVANNRNDSGSNHEKYGHYRYRDPESSSTRRTAKLSRVDMRGFLICVLSAPRKDFATKHFRTARDAKVFPEHCMEIGSVQKLGALIHIPNSRALIFRTPTKRNPPPISVIWDVVACGSC